MFLVPLTHIDDNPFQARTDYREINEFALNIEAQLPTQPETRGLLQLPIGRLVNEAGKTIPIERLLGKGNVSPSAIQTVLSAKKWRIQLLFGHRRRQAMKALAEAKIPPYKDGLMPLRLQDLTDTQMLDGVWGENENRQELSDIERAQLLQAKLNQPKANGTFPIQAEVAELWGLNRSTVANLLRLLKLPPEVQEANRQGHLSQRQCLALLPMWQLAQLLENPETTKPSQRWGEGIPDPDAPAYHRPLAPQAFIDRLLADAPEKKAFTAEQIRQYTTLQLNYVGQRIPPELSTYIVANPEAVQPRCVGCAFRVKDSCLQTSCLAIKRKQYASELTQALAEIEGVTFSDKPEDFTRLDTYAKQQEALKRWLAGEREHLVLGWQTDRSLTCLADSTHPWPSEVEGIDDLTLQGMVIGYDTALPADFAPQPNRRTNHEAWGQQFEWRTAAQAQIKQIRQRAVTALAEQFQSACPDEAVAQSLLLLLEPFSELEKRMSRLDKAEAYHLFVDKLWRSRDGYDERADALVMWEKATTTLGMAGIGEAVLHEADGKTAVRQQCERVLGYWYEQDYKHAGVVKRTWRHLQEAKQVLQEGGWLEDDAFVVLDEGLTAVSEAVQASPFFADCLARGEVVALVP